MDDSITPTDDANTSAQNISPEGTVVFNVGGVTFETYRSTLLRIPNSPLTNSSFLEEHFRPEKKEYFFDKDPDAFKIILDYLRTGQLYIPTFIDRPSLRNDLLFWGLDPNSIQQTGSTGPAQQNVVNSGSTVAFPAETMIVSNTETTRMKIWNILSEPATSMPAKLYAAFAYFLIFVSVYIMVFKTTSLFRHKRNDEILNVSGNDTSDVYFEENDTLESDSPIDNHSSLYIIALVINLFFTVEYIIRVVVAPNRIQFLFSFLGVIDFLAILPDYALVILSEFVDRNVTMIKILGVFRILRALRVLKHFKTPLNTDVFVSAFKASAGEMVFVSSLIAIGTLASGSVCFFIETGSSSTEYSHFRSIPEACYWAIITLTTVGYGDMLAITPAGRIFSAFTALFGLVMIGLVVSVLVKNFIECSKQTQNRTTCHGVAHEYKNVEEYRPLISSSPVGQNI